SAVGRTPFNHRAAVVGADAGDVLGGLQALAAGRTAEGVLRSGEKGVPKGGRRVGFYFGSPPVSASMSLRDWLREPIWRAAMQRCERAASRPVDSLAAEVAAVGDPAAQGGASPLVTLAVQLASYDQWVAWGIAPSAVVVDGPAGALAGAVATGEIPLE